VPKSRLALYSTRRRWTDTEAHAVLAALDSSGLSVSAFAMREGLDVQRLYFWRRRREAAVETAVTPAFVEVRRHAAEHVEVVLRSGRILRVSESIDTASLRRLVDVLDPESSC
jgi:transposase-like protein